MALIVQKYGGTSVGDVERIRRVAQRVAATRKAGNDVVVVVSAMGKETDRLVQLARDISTHPNEREYDVLVSTGEQQTIALLAMALHEIGVPARSFTGPQVGMKTDGDHSRARIETIECDRVRAELARGSVVIVAGFQGVDSEGDITTLGRGGSDTSAVALAAALSADACEICTDVDGVFTGDPNLIPNARKLRQISYDEMLETASLGAAVLQLRAVKFGKRYGVRIHVRSSFRDREGTWVVPESDVMERLVVSAVTYNRNEAKITVIGGEVRSTRQWRLEDIRTAFRTAACRCRRDRAERLFRRTDRRDLHACRAPICSSRPRIGGKARQPNSARAAFHVGRFDRPRYRSMGLGMKDHAGVAGKMFDCPFGGRH